MKCQLSDFYPFFNIDTPKRKLEERTNFFVQTIGRKCIKIVNFTTVFISGLWVIWIANILLATKHCKIFILYNIICYLAPSLHNKFAFQKCRINSFNFKSYVPKRLCERLPKRVRF